MLRKELQGLNQSPGANKEASVSGVSSLLFSFKPCILDGSQLLCTSCSDSCLVLVFPSSVSHQDWEKIRMTDVISFRKVFNYSVITTYYLLQALISPNNGAKILTCRVRSHAAFQFSHG